ncbi:MAG: hypothetical protein V1724_09490 [Chloroflexota bacterium]
MNEVATVVELLKEEVDRLRAEIHHLEESRRDTHRQLLVTQRLVKVLLGGAFDESLTVGFRESPPVRKAYTAWLVECNSQLRNLLKKPGAKARWNELLVHEPLLTYGEVLDELEKV